MGRLCQSASLLRSLYSSAGRNGEDQDRESGQGREGGKGGAWQQNIYTLRIADYAANLARWMRPPCSKSYFPLDWHHVAGWHLERCPFSRVKINFKFKLPK